MKDLLQFDQCLFGYDDGHRLLASSMPLGEAASTLTLLSDLAPGTTFNANNGYWTGFPAPDLRRYVLMRTWPAPEMPRPGCVWTHALLLKPSDFELLPRLEVLIDLFRRPLPNQDAAIYRGSVSLSVEQMASAHVPQVSEATLKVLVTALYAHGANPVAAAAAGDVEDAVFALWSQQWPRLRRNFRFQTALRRDPIDNGPIKFDLQLRRDDLPLSRTPAEEAPGWVKEAAEDAAHPERSGLRTFLWHYGADVVRQKASFRPLCLMRVLDTSHDRLLSPTIVHLLDEAFPEEGDARALKQDVVDGNILGRAQIGILRQMVDTPDHVLPVPTPVGIARLAGQWRKHSSEMLELGDEVSERADSLSMTLFQAIADLIPLEQFWVITEEYPRLQMRMLREHPELIRTIDVARVEASRLGTLLAMIPAEAPDYEELIPKVLHQFEPELVELLFGRRPAEVARIVLRTLSARPNAVSSAWLQRLVREPSVLLTAPVMKEVGRASLLYELVEGLGWLSDAVIAHGTSPWLAALAPIEPDISLETADVLRSFLLALAVRAPSDSSRHLIERFFDDVHARILNGRLDPKALELLERVLPDLGFWNWNTGMRFRLMIARTYIENGYDPASYAKLAKTRRVMSQLADAADACRGGRKYARAAH